jgi:hypothetical protein
MEFSRKQNVLSLKEKLDVLLNVSDNVSTNKSLEKFGIGLSTSHNIKSLKAAALSNSNFNFKRKRMSSYEDLNKTLSKTLRAKNCLVSGLMKMEKTTQLVLSMNIEFSPSNGWLHRWKQNDNITFHSVQGEKGVADSPAAENWITTVLPELIHGRNKCDI